jgi:hypothetical protein
MALTFSSTAAPGEMNGVKFLVHAPMGYGKTDLLLTLPGDPCIISAESGLLTLAPANQMRRYGKVVDWPVLKITQGSDLEAAYQAAKGVGPHGRKFTSVGIDSLSEIAESILTAELRVAKDPRQAYGRMQELMYEYIRKFRDLEGVHVYFTAKQDKTVEADGIARFSPMMPGKTLSLQVGHFFDEVFAIKLLDVKDERGNNYRALHTRPDIKYSCKDRSGALDEIEEPNLAKIIAKIQAK